MMWRLAPGRKFDEGVGLHPTQTAPRTGPRLASGYIDREHNAE